MGQVDRVSETEVQAQAQFLKALQLRILEKYDEAIEAFTELEKEDPQNDVIQFELAKLYWVKRKDVEASLHGKRAVELNPDRPAYQEFLIDLYSETRDYAALNETLNQFIRSGHFNESYYFQLASTHKKMGQYDEALDILEELEDRVGYRKNIGQTRVSIYRMQDNRRRMIRELDRLAEHFPADTNVLLQQATLLESIGEEKRAMEVYRQLISIDPNHVAANRKLTLGTGRKESEESYLSSLKKLVENQNYPRDEKIRELARFVPRLNRGDELTAEMLDLMGIMQNLYPANARVNALHGDVYFNTLQPEEAKIYYQRTLDLDKSVFLVWKNLMMAQDNTQDYEGLLRTATQAVDYFPNQAVCYYYAGKANLETGHPDAGREWLQEGVFLAGNNPTLKSEFNLMLTRYHLIREDSNTAKTFFDRVESQFLGPRHALYFELKGDLEYSAGQTDEALRSWQQALENGGPEKRIRDKMDRVEK
jgi:tetratricopeptide (TPR) repeat protein